MASLSLPRVLQQRKTSLEIERENFEKCQQTAIQKAINNLETPVKQKHVRSTIIGTFQEKGAQIFWIVVLRLPLQEDRIVAWKFCHVLHKLLREGYPTTILHSQRHRAELENIGKLWVHLRDCYGKLIKLYCTLLIAKLDFHRRNPRFPGNLALTHSELEHIGENDINNYFQMAVEMFDYMDTILDLQAAIFGSIDRSRSNSMTSSGQCRLSPLIPCIQDASRLYDFCVKILFKLHNALPADTLSGHRERFLKQFKELKLFYQNANMLQYFKTLITIPSLPENPPNFLIQAELRSYVTPVVIIPPEEPEIEVSVLEGSLVDTSESRTGSDVGDSASQNGTTSPSQHFTEIVAERDRLIEHLQTENKGLRSEILRLTKESQAAVNKLQDQITAVETELATKDSELIQERQLKEDLLEQAATQAACVQSHDSEKKLKDEKFEKMKTLYTNLREKHIQLIREKADVDKKLNISNASLNELQKSKNNFESELENVSQEKDLEIIGLKEIKDKLNFDLNNLQKERDILVSENEALNSKIEKFMHDKSNLEYQLSDISQQKRQFEDKILSLETTNNNTEQALSQLKQDKDNELITLILATIRQSELIMKHAIDEVDNPVLSGVTCSPDYFCLMTEPCLEAIAKVSETKNNPKEVCISAIRLAHVMAVYVVQGRAASNSSPDIMFGEQMAVKCKQLATLIITILQSLQSDSDISESVEQAVNEVKAMRELAETLQGTLRENSSELLADLVENELSSMDKAIEEAAHMMQEMLRKSREADSGIKLEVNEKILDSCTKLMQAIRVLVQKSKLLQAEIVAQGKGSASIKEFYKRNHRWTDGLISAAKAVGTAASFLLNSADKVVQEQGKLEQLAVAAQEIAASTAQLVVASRVKANRNSDNLRQVGVASKNVTSATGEVVATVKDCANLMDEHDEFDASKLTLHVAKRQEMDTQIRVLELEKELEQHRLKLAALRRQHYQLAGESEGWVS